MKKLAPLAIVAFLLLSAAIFGAVFLWSGGEINEVEGIYQKTPVNIVSNVSTYRRNGVFEIYGSSYRQVRGGPITVDRVTLENSTSEPGLVLAWTPTQPISVTADSIEIQFAGENQVKPVAFAAQYCNHEALTVYSSEISQLSEFVSQIDNHRGRAAFVDLLSAPASFEQPAGQYANGLSWRLEDETHCVERLFLFVDITEAEGPVSLDYAGFARRRLDSDRLISISIEEARPFSVDVDIIFESGKSVKLFPTLDGDLTFSLPEQDEPYSVRVQRDGTYFYSQYGRWLSGVAGRPLVVKARRPAADLSKKVDTAENLFHGRRKPSDYASIYPDHVAMRYVGVGKVQEYDNYLFTNNFGYHDQDRLFENDDDCFRIFVAGSSTTDAIQVPVNQHFSTLAEEDLGIAIDRCVEVISASTSNGDMSASWEHWTNYGTYFDPDLVLFETEPELMLQMNDVYASSYLGWALHNPPKGRFTRDAAGDLSYVPRSLTYHTDLNPEPPRSGLPDGYNDRAFYYYDFDALPPELVEVFDLKEAILTLAEEGSPTTQFGMLSIVRQLTCKGDCPSSPATLPTGQTVSVGIQKWLENFDRECDRRDWYCINPPLPDGFDRPGNFLSWDFDGHPSPSGHQWIAREMAGAVLEACKNPSRATVCR